MSLAPNSLVIASQLEPALNDALASHPARPRVIAAPEDEPWRAAADADVLVVRPSPAWAPARAAPAPPVWPGRLRWVCSASAGIDFYPAWLLDGPLVSCARGTASEEIADYVIGAIYRQAKDLDGVAARGPEGWRYSALGQVLGSTIGLVGLGAIGQAVARRALALGARVVAVRRTGALPEGLSGVELVARVEDVVARADHIVLAVPATPQTRHLVDATLLARAKPGAHLVNVARGSVVDQAALLEALDRGHLGFATLDVTDPEPLPAGHRLYTHPRVRLTPHLSSNYTVARDKLLAKILGDITRFAQGEPPRDLVEPARGY
ncbi:MULTISPECIES: NAD(P)-dependent oxidoreductase [unclassified Novosphingobium]|uniref:NAD(P)-dependent oxidoreductase n=1 Tax=unclassified Novosphingobium TaxID=2644732 RepID=UPI00146E76B9|nr:MULTISPECIES: NAD(P)-dependent oxidoreductase [unclassified Novosphingobium]NMN05356.1 phosphoglycerate dehydrogenase-like enzyme [Novosphingobium sp. SG919]NMN87651.1 phosphoglycerate dehydrogenase-like enzyme [Novosphingobium sp. SG916]